MKWFWQKSPAPEEVKFESVLERIVAASEGRLA